MEVVDVIEAECCGATSRCWVPSYMEQGQAPSIESRRHVRCGTAEASPPCGCLMLQTFVAFFFFSFTS